MIYLYGLSCWNCKTVITYGLKRFFRVYPAYIVVVFGSFLIFQYTNFTYKMTFEELQKHIILNGGISVFWTIPVEMKFYLIFPFVAAIISWIRDDKHKIYALLILFSAALLIDANGDDISTWRYLEFFMGGYVQDIYT